MIIVCVVVFIIAFGLAGFMLMSQGIIANEYPKCTSDEEKEENQRALGSNIRFTVGCVIVGCVIGLFANSSDKISVAALAAIAVISAIVGMVIRIVMNQKGM